MSEETSICKELFHQLPSSVCTSSRYYAWTLSLRNGFSPWGHHSVELVFNQPPSPTHTHTPLFCTISSSEDKLIEMELCTHFLITAPETSTFYTILLLQCQFCFHCKKCYQHEWGILDHFLFCFFAMCILDFLKTKQASRRGSKRWLWLWQKCVCTLFN